ncbi:protein-disulfide reductase DsbD domain-containing protein, partial [Klebsiella pneumoniae]|uniref:protein-disulfide reductase DsbD domain-containing protein n=1 Tax=Klebsiella pneumoniae TaxID=573 RepID=UPI0025A250C7
TSAGGAMAGACGTAFSSIGRGSTGSGGLKAGRWFSDDTGAAAGEWHEDEFYGKSEIFRQRLTVPVTVKEADKEATLTVTWQG